jgi:hypothetical protein
MTMPASPRDPSTNPLYRLRAVVAHRFREEVRVEPDIRSVGSFLPLWLAIVVLIMTGAFLAGSCKVPLFTSATVMASRTVDDQHSRLEMALATEIPIRFIPLQTPVWIRSRPSTICCKGVVIEVNNTLPTKLVHQRFGPPGLTGNNTSTIVVSVQVSGSEGSSTRWEPPSTVTLRIESPNYSLLSYLVARVFHPREGHLDDQ